MTFGELPNNLPPNQPRPALSAEAVVARQRVRDLEQLAGAVELELIVARERFRTLTKPPRRLVQSTPKGTDPATVRAWARLNGWPELGDRGRMPVEVHAAYCTANPSDAQETA